TVLRRTIRIAPLFSSISTSACTVGPCFLASAALMPSSRSPCNSARSICFEFVNSRIAVRISTEAAMSQPLPFPMKSQPRLFDRGERKTPLITALVAHNHDFLPGIAFDTGNLNFIRPPTRRIARDVRGDHSRPADESLPILAVPEWSLDPRRRHFQNIFLFAEILGVEPGLDRARCCRAIIDRHFFAI